MNPSHRLHSRRSFVTALGLGSAATALLPRCSGAADTADSRRRYDVRASGAAGDGSHLDTRALQSAIDACAAAGGGTVHFPAGRYLTGTLFLKSRVTLHLEAGATLLGSRNLEDYPRTLPALRSYTDNYTERSLIYGENLEQVALHGRGVVDGQGAAFKGPYKVRPYLVRLIGCKGVSVRDLTLKDSPMWVQHYLACDNVLIDGITVTSKCNANNDGLDIDGCHRVRIAHCDINSGDDAIVLKSTLDRPCRDVVITNCVLSSDCNAFKLGTESNGGFENIALSNCTIYDTRLAGIALECVDGGTLDRVTISNITMSRAVGGLFIRLGNRARPFEEGGKRPGWGRLQNVSISNVIATDIGKVGCSITGLPEHPAANISLRNLRLHFAGGGTAEDAARAIPEHPEKYPEFQMFGTLPAYGLYCRHVRGLELSAIRVDYAQPEQRPSLVCDDVDDLEVHRWHAARAAGSSPIVRFQQVTRGFVHGCQCPEGAPVFLHAPGAANESVRLLANHVPASTKEVAWEGR